MAEQNNNGFWKGKTEATLEGIAKKLDELQEMFNHCPMGAAHSRSIRVLMVAVGAVLFILLVTHPKEMADFLAVLVR